VLNQKEMKILQHDVGVYEAWLFRVLHLKVEVFDFKARKSGLVKWISTVFPDPINQL
jgi:hypothetical protein